MKKERIKAQQDFRKSEDTSFDESLYRPLVEKLSGDADAARIYGENLRHYRQRQGVTQEELANVIGVTNIVDGAAGDTGLLRGVAHFLRHHVGIAQIGEADGQAHGVAEGQNLLQVLICESLYKNTPLSD